VIALGQCGRKWFDRFLLYFISQSILFDFLLHAYIILIKKKKFVQDSLAVTPWETLAQYHFARGFKVIHRVHTWETSAIAVKCWKGNNKRHKGESQPKHHMWEHLCENSACHSLTTYITAKHLTSSGGKKITLAFKILILSYQYRSMHILSTGWSLDIAW
jgi:hypothetical protein